MRHYIQATILFTLTLTSQFTFAEYKVHEWGTFTSLVGSDGITQPGMYHEDEALPDFVHQFGDTQTFEPAPIPIPRPTPIDDCRNRKVCVPVAVLQQANITQKMETPVIYFYSDQVRTVDVNVKFPLGVITETFPAPVKTSPSQTTERLTNGDTTFRVEVQLEKDLLSSRHRARHVPPGNIYGHARNVESNIVRTNQEAEKFIFYRGIGRFQPKMAITSVGGALNIEQCATCERIPSIFLVHVDQLGRGNMLPLGGLAAHNDKINVAPNTIEGLMEHPVPRGGNTGVQMRKDLLAALTKAGLNSDEAIAMVDTWENGYLKVPGLRLLYVLPRSEVERVLPMDITPAPEELKRVFIGRIEILRDTDEKELLSRIVQNRCVDCPNSLGRFAEPILRRAREVYVSSQVNGRDPLYSENLLKFEELIAKSATGYGTAAVH
jgi:hypothetical protein